jgi:hypothetical protein
MVTVAALAAVYRPGPGSGHAVRIGTLPVRLPLRAALQAEPSNWWGCDWAVPESRRPYTQIHGQPTK